TAAAAEGDLLTLKLRYKLPDGDTSTLLEFPVKDAGAAYGAASGEFKFAAAVAGFGMLLRRSPFAGNLSFDAVKELATEGKGADPHGYRAEFLDLVARANALQPPPPAAAAPAETPAEEPAAKQP
ncbi:MAG: YfbK domain-containing protein, partial [Pirellulales bacterium]